MTNFRSTVLMLILKILYDFGQFCELKVPNSQNIIIYIFLSLFCFSDKTAIENRLRDAIKDIFPCNILFDNPLYPHPHRQFDCVIVSSILECACQDKTSYERSVANISRLLKPGGCLLLHGYLEENFCRVGREYFQSFSVDAAFVRSTFSKAGFGNLQLAEVQIPSSDRYSSIDGQQWINTDAESMLFMSATKL